MGHLDPAISTYQKTSGIGPSDPCLTSHATTATSHLVVACLLVLHLVVSHLIHLIVSHLVAVHLVATHLVAVHLVPAVAAITAVPQVVARAIEGSYINGPRRRFREANDYYIITHEIQVVKHVLQL